MYSFLKSFVIAVLAFLVLDALWFQFTLPSYGSVVQAVQGAPLTVRVVPMALTYLLMAAGVVYFISCGLSQEGGRPYGQVFLTGALLGLYGYGLFNLTNLTLLKDWRLSMSVIDTLWGAFATGLVAVAVTALT